MKGRLLRCSWLPLHIHLANGRDEARMKNENEIMRPVLCNQKYLTMWTRCQCLLRCMWSPELSRLHSDALNWNERERGRLLRCSWFSLQADLTDRGEEACMKNGNDIKLPLCHRTLGSRVSAVQPKVDDLVSLPMLPPLHVVIGTETFSALFGYTMFKRYEQREKIAAYGTFFSLAFRMKDVTGIHRMEYVAERSSNQL